MPFRKQTKYQAAIMKQHKLIKKRLMEISIRVDNYIYNNKAISATDAEKYVREIFGYKIQCSSDVRMLQVIEKLTRFMKMIIKETTKNSTTNPNTTISDIEQIINMSVVPSVDKKKVDSGMSEIVIGKNDTEKPKHFTKCSGENEPQNCVYEIKKKTNKINETTVKSSTNIGTLCDTVFDNILATKNIANIKNMEISQDALNYNNYIESTKGNTNTIESNKGQFKNTESKTTKIVKNTHHKFTPPLKSHQIDTEKKNYLREPRKDAQRENQIADECNTVKEVKINTSAEPKSAAEKKRKRVRKTRDNISTTGKVNNEKRRRRAANKKQSNNSEPTISLLLPSNNTSSYTTPNKNHTGVDSVNEVSCTTSGEQRNKFKNLATNQDNLISKQMDHIKMDNQRSENDLSWIDGVKYVRQVSTAEFDTKLNNLEESFWDNCALPSGWDDAEFLY